MPHPPANPKLKTLILSNCQDVSKNEVQKFFEKDYGLNSVVKHDKLIFVEFNERKQAEEAMKAFYGKLIINNNSLGLSWNREEEQDEDSEEGLLIPGSGFKLLKKDI